MPPTTRQQQQQQHRLATPASRLNGDDARKHTGSSAVGPLLFRAASLAYGLFSLSTLGLRAAWEGYVTQRPGAGFWRRVAAARNKYWDLSWTHDGFSHAFHTLADGRKLHFVSNAPLTGLTKTQNLVIFLHGWPDSWMLWRTCWASMSAEARESAILVAVDLPGFGGSDCLDAYGPGQVLEAVADFILAMREQYLAQPGQDSDADDSGLHEPRTIVACHDWGAIIGLRLAAEAPQLADRFIVANGCLGHLARSNMSQRLATTRRLLSTWLKSPLKLGLLRSASTAVFPVLAQLKRSFYVFVYNLPQPLPQFWGALGDCWFSRFAASLGAGHRYIEHSEATAEHMASAFGPSADVLSTATANGQGYGASVRQRSQRSSFYESVRLYREGLLLRRWNKSLTLLSELYNLDQAATTTLQKARRQSSGTGLIDDGPPGALRAPTTVVWGARDPAMLKTIMFEGVGEYMMCKGSGIVTIARAGHWVPSDGGGAGVFARIVSWAVEGERQGLDAVLEAEGAGVKVENLK